MQVRKLVVAAGFAALLAAPALLATAQNAAPFTIRQPPDGATVREKVKVEIPLASIPEEGYVAYSIDGQFRVALSPTDEERQKLNDAAEKSKKPAMFSFVWDTKQPVKVRNTDQAPADGEHEISATLFAPSGTAGGSKVQQTSSVRVQLANKVVTDPGAIHLKYRFPDATNRTYERNGDTVVVTGLTQGMQGASDQELVAQRSKLLVAVEDVYGDGSAIVRNKLQELVVRQNGQETTYPSDQLPKSLYQQLNQYGDVMYQNDTASFDQFAQMGIPVDATIDLPKLPREAVKVGDTWQAGEERLDIPGTAPDKQPVVSLSSTLEGVEWEGGYPTAKIHQSFDSTRGGLKAKSIIFGTYEITNPTIKYDRDIYLAYRSGTLVKVIRKLEVTGKTAQAVSGAAPGMGYGGAMMGTGIPGGPMGGPMGPMSGGGKMGNMSMGAGGMGSPYGRGGGYGPPAGSGGYGGYPGSGGSYGAPAGGRQRGGGRRGGPMGSSGMPYGAGGGMPYGSGSTGYGSGIGPGGGPGSPYGGMSGGYGAPMGGYGGGAGQAQASSQITLRSTTTTELAR